MLRHLLPLAIFIIVAGFLFVGLSLNPRDIGSTRLDKGAPEFNLPTVMDPATTLSEQDFLGQVSLFNAWASWCVSCRYEHPLLMELANRTDIPIYGLNYKDTRLEAQQLLTRQGNPYRASAFDAEGRVGIDWGLTGTPETFVVDQQGIVRYKHTGPLTVEVLEREIFPLMQELNTTYHES